MAVLLILGGAAVPVWRGAAKDSATLEKEAQALMHWTSSLMTRANRSGRPFEIFCPGNKERNVIEAIWSNPIEKETYSSLYGCNFIRYQSSIAESRYYPQWNALVPTITIKVRRAQAEHFVIISQHGRVRTSTVPPPR